MGHLHDAAAGAGTSPPQIGPAGMAQHSALQESQQASAAQPASDLILSLPGAESQSLKLEEGEGEEAAAEEGGQNATCAPLLCFRIPKTSGELLATPTTPTRIPDRTELGFVCNLDGYVQVLSL